MQLAAYGRQIAVGTREQLRMYHAGATPALATPLRSEWVTNVETTRGGPILDRIGALAYDERGTLFILTASGINVRTVDGRISAYTPLDGLPCANGTALQV